MMMLIHWLNDYCYLYSPVLSQQRKWGCQRQHCTRRLQNAPARKTTRSLTTAAEAQQQNGSEKVHGGNNLAEEYKAMINSLNFYSVLGWNPLFILCAVFRFTQDNIFSVKAVGVF